MQHHANNRLTGLDAFEDLFQHLHTSVHICIVDLNVIFCKSIKAFAWNCIWWDAPSCLWAQSAGSQLRWGCWLKTPRGDLARAPYHFNHSSPLTGSQISLCSLGTRRALTNHLPSLLYFSLSSLPLSAMMLLNEKGQWGEKIWDWFICFSVLWDGVLSLSFFPVSLSLSFSANWNQLASRALVAGNVGQARSNKKVLTFLWLYAAWKGCRGLVRHERSSINFTYFTQAPVRRP